ncbi:lipopolysaccharide biosynthesis protein [Liquorilactobacillus mali]|nr:lipopolysaccharide biosynthesis protein [Liquorilactobacillus mali]
MKKSKLKEKVFNGMFWRFGEQISSQLVTFIISVILARILSPREYGLVAIVTIFIAIANVFVTEGFGTALIQKKDADIKDFSSVFYFNLIFSWLVYLIIFLLSNYIAIFFKEPELKPVMRILAIVIPITGLNSIQQAYVSKKMIFKRFFWSTLIGTTISGLLGIFFAYRGYGIWSLVIQQIMNIAINTIVLWFTVKWRPILYFSLKRIRTLLSYGWKILVTNLINSIYDNSINILIGRMYSSSALAFYNRGINYPNLIISNVTTSISSVIFPALSEIQNDREKMKRAIRISISVGTFLIFPLMGGLFAISNNLVLWMLTKKWLPAVPFMKIACIFLALYPINITNLQAIMAVGRSDVYLRLNIIKKGIGLTLIACSVPFGLYGMASSQIIVGLVAIFTNISANKRLFNYSFEELFYDCFKNIVSSVFMTVIVMFIGSTISDSTNIYIAFILLIQILIGILLYIVFSIFLKSKELYYILSILKGYFLKKKIN